VIKEIVLNVSIKLTILLLTLIFMANCSKTSEDPSAQYTEIPLSSGTWISTCHLNEANLNIQSEFVFDDKVQSLNETSYVYSDSSCQFKVGKLERASIYTTSNLRGSSNDSNSSNTNTGSYSIADLNMKLVSITITPIISGQATQWNNASFCGINNWYLNASIDVSGKICNGFSFPASSSTEYSFAQYYFSNAIMDSQNISKESLFLGVSDGSNDGTSISSRKTKINIANPLTIKP
jgi:hypothetical protein